MTRRVHHVQRQLAVPLAFDGLAFDVKRTDRLRPADLRGLRAFVAEYPMARPFLLYGGDRVLHDDGIDLLPLDVALRGLRGLLESGGVRQG